MKRLLPVVLLAVCAAACSSSAADPAPVALPPLSAAPSVAVSPAPVVTPVAQVPVEAQANTREGAEAFARYFWSEFDRAYSTLNKDVLAAVSDDACLSCQGYVRDLVSTKSAAERYEGGLVTVQSAVCAPIDDHGASLVVVYDATELSLYEPNGARSVVLPARARVAVTMQLVWDDAGWRVAEVMGT